MLLEEFCYKFTYKFFSVSKSERYGGREADPRGTVTGR